MKPEDVRWLLDRAARPQRVYLSLAELGTGGLLQPEELEELRANGFRIYEIRVDGDPEPRPCVEVLEHVVACSNIVAWDELLETLRAAGGLVLLSSLAADR